LILTVFRVLLAHSIPAVIGVIFLSWLEGGKGKLGGLEKVVLGFALGSGLISFYMFYLGLLRIPFTLGRVSAIFWPFGILGILLGAKRGLGSLLHFSRPSLFRGLGRTGKCLLVLISALLICKIIFIGFIVLNVPTYFDDSVSIWNYKAKVYYYRQGIVPDKNDPDLLGGYNPHYPNGVPLFKCWVSIWAGEWTESAVNLNTFMIFLCLGLLFYYNLKHYLPDLPAYAVTYLLLSVPLLTFHSGFAHFDLWVGFYFLAGTMYLYRWMKEKVKFHFILSALLIAVGLSVKRETAAFFIWGLMPTLIIYQIAGREKLFTIIKQTALYLFVALVPNLPWYVAIGVYKLQVGLYEGAMRLEFHPEAFNLLANRFFSSGNYGILWIIFFAILIITLPAVLKSSLKYLLLLVGLSLAASLSIFIITPFFEWLRVGTTINRAMLGVIPVMVYYSALACQKLVQHPDKPK